MLNKFYDLRKEIEKSGDVFEEQYDHFRIQSAAVGFVLFVCTVDLVAGVIGVVSNEIRAVLHQNRGRQWRAYQEGCCACRESALSNGKKTVFSGIYRGFCAPF